MVEAQRISRCFKEGVELTSLDLSDDDDKNISFALVGKGLSLEDFEGYEMQMVNTIGRVNSGQTLEAPQVRVWDPFVDEILFNNVLPVLIFLFIGTCLYIFQTSKPRNDIIAWLSGNGLLYKSELFLYLPRCP